MAPVRNTPDTVVNGAVLGRPPLPLEEPRQAENQP